MAQAQVEQPVVDVAAIGGERRRPVGQPPDDDPERVDDRDAEHEQGDRDLGRPEDRQDRQGVADEHDPARPDEDRGRVEVPAQEPEQRPGQDEAEQGDERLAEGPAAVVRLISPRVAAAMSEIPDDSPSSPSMKLMLLIIPTIQTIVNATANASPRTIWPGPTGLAMLSTVTPAATAPRATASWPTSCQRARIWRTSSRKPIAAATRPPMSRAPSSGGPDARPGCTTEPIAPRSTRMTTTIATVRNAAATARPPARGIGRRLTRRASGRSTRSNAREKRRTPGSGRAPAGRPTRTRRRAPGRSPRPPG